MQRLKEQGRVDGGFGEGLVLLYKVTRQVGDYILLTLIW